MCHYNYDYFDDFEFHGDTSTISYLRWLYNRYGYEKVIKEFKLERKLADKLGNSDFPGKIKVSMVDTIEKYIAYKNTMNMNRQKREFVNTQNNDNLMKFRMQNSRRIKVRLNKFLDYDIIFILRNLIDAEEANIAAKNTYGKYVEYNYNKKSACIKEAIAKLKTSTLDYFWQSDNEKQASYIFYVILPTGAQVSWHGMNDSDMDGVPKNNFKKWDGKLASTLPKLIDCVFKIIPSINDEKFDKKKCELEIKEYIINNS